MHWGRLIDFTSSSSQLLDDYLLQDFSSSPNLVITFLFGNIVWESTGANHCIGHWHETGLQTFQGHPSSSHIGSLGLCLHHYWKFGQSYWSIEAGWSISHQVQVNCCMVISCKISLAVQIWSSHFCLATYCESQLWLITVLDICTSQGCESFKVTPPHLILVAQFVFASLLEICIKLLKHWGRPFSLSLKFIIERSSFKKVSLKWCQVELIQTRSKQSLQLIRWKKIPFILIKWRKSVNPYPSQATVDSVKKTPWDLYNECLDEGEAQQIQTSNLVYPMNMQVRYAVVRATVRKQRCQ